MANAAQRLDPGERRVRMPPTSEWEGIFFGVDFFFFFFLFLRRKLCLHTNVCVFACVRMLGSI